MDYMKQRLMGPSWLALPVQAQGYAGDGAFALLFLVPLHFVHHSPNKMTFKFEIIATSHSNSWYQTRMVLFVLEKKEYS